MRHVHLAKVDEPDHLIHLPPPHSLEEEQGVLLVAPYKEAVEELACLAKDSPMGLDEATILSGQGDICELLARVELGKGGHSPGREILGG